MNYYATARTNYFHVTDEAKFKQLMAGLSAEGGCHPVKDDNDPTMYAILFDGSASFYRPASLIPEFMEMIEGKTVYDDKQTPIPIDEIDSHNCLYDEEGECIFDRWADDDEFDFEGWDDDDDDSEDHFPTDAEDDDFDIDAAEE